MGVLNVFKLKKQNDLFITTKSLLSHLIANFTKLGIPGSLENHSDYPYILLLKDPVTHLLAIQQKLGAETVHVALDDWYMAQNKDYEVFAKKHPMNGELK